MVERLRLPAIASAKAARPSDSIADRLAFYKREPSLRPAVNVTIDTQDDIVLTSQPLDTSTSHADFVHATAPAVPIAMRAESNAD